MYTGHEMSEECTRRLPKVPTMWKWVNFSVLALSFVDSAETRECILSVDVHGA